MFTRRDLDQLVLDVELVLVSVVQGVALTALGVEAMPALRDHHPTGYVFLASGLLFLFAFWAGALMHTISYVRWPIDLPHYFFYFAIGFLEMITFAQIEHPRAWFGTSIAFYVVALGLYAYDLSMIERRRARFDESDASRALFAHVHKRQRHEMLYVMPAGLAFNLAAWWLLGRNAGWELGLAVVQLLFTVGFLGMMVRSFSERVKLIGACADES